MWLVATTGHLSSLYKCWPSVHFIDYTSILKNKIETPTTVPCFVITFNFLIFMLLESYSPNTFYVPYCDFVCNLSQFVLFKNIFSWMWLFFFFFFPDLLLPTVPFLFDHTISYGTHEKYILALGVIHCFFECLIHYL